MKAARGFLDDLATIAMIGLTVALFLLVLPGLLVWIAGEYVVDYIHDRVVITDSAGQPWHGLWLKHTPRGSWVKVSGRFGVVPLEEYERQVDSAPPARYLPSREAYKDAMRRFLDG